HPFPTRRSSDLTLNGSPARPPCSTEDSPSAARSGTSTHGSTPSAAASTPTTYTGGPPPSAPHGHGTASPRFTSWPTGPREGMTGFYARRGQHTTGHMLSSATTSQASTRRSSAPTGSRLDTRPRRPSRP